VSFPGGSGELRFVRALDGEGNAWANPMTLASDSFSNVGFYTSMRIVQGHPAISYLDETNVDLMYIRASSADGSSWNSPVTVDSTDEPGSFTSLLIVDGNPAISHWDRLNNELKYVRATDTAGDSWGASVVVDSSGANCLSTSLAIIGNRPAIGYRVENGGHHARFVRASDSHGVNWQPPINVASEVTFTLVEALLFDFRGKPAMIFNRTGSANGLQMQVANDASGTSWPSSLGIPIRLDVGNGRGRYPSVVLLQDGSPVFAYHDNVLKTLKFANPF
jgi:hypothetical protein